MVDILLIQPPVQDFYLTAKRTIPYGLTCIAAVLKREGFSVSLFDALATKRVKPLDQPPEMSFLDRFYGEPDQSPFALFHQFKHFGYSFQHIGHVARESGAFLIGISSLFSAYSDAALETAATVKAWLPTATVVMGGHHPTAMPEAVIGHPAVDFVLRGEGEVSLPALARCLKEGRSMETVPGIVYRRTSGEVVVTPPAVMEDLAAFPLPDDSLIKDKFYQRSHGGSAVILTSRGCPMSCSYCCVAGWPYRRRSVHTVLEEMDRAISGRGVRFIDFEDENLSLDRGWFTELLDGIISKYEGLSLELRAMNGLFAPTLDGAVIKKMKSAGFKTLNLSLGSADAHQQKRFCRPPVKNAFEEAVAYARSIGLDAVGYIIVGAPGQTAESSVDDLLYLGRQGILAGVSAYYPAPGSADYTRLETAGHLPSSTGLLRSSTLPECPPATRKERITLLRLGRILNFIHRLQSVKSKPERGSQLATDRLEMGRHLLGDFLRDGRICGMKPNGTPFIHDVSSRLVTRFIDGLQANSPAGLAGFIRQETSGPWSAGRL
jgi:anaerobic magnesium-protoporphyrin IX monomethyl ester cyclase